MTYCRLIRKVKNLNIYVSLLFNKLEPASGSRGGLGGACLGGAQGYRPPPTTPLITTKSILQLKHVPETQHIQIAVFNVKNV